METNEVKALFVAAVTQFDNSPPVLSQTASRSTARVPARIITFAFRDTNLLNFSWFSPGTFHSPISILH